MINFRNKLSGLIILAILAVAHYVLIVVNLRPDFLSKEVFYYQLAGMLFQLAPFLIAVMLYTMYKRDKLSVRILILALCYLSISFFFVFYELMIFNGVHNNPLNILYELIILPANVLISLACIYYLIVHIELTKNSSINVILKTVAIIIGILIILLAAVFVLLMVSCGLTGNCL